MLVVIGGGVQVAALSSEPLAYLAKADKTIGRPVQRVGDHGVDSRYRGAFLVGTPVCSPPVMIAGRIDVGALSRCAPGCVGEVGQCSCQPCLRPGRA
jgi:hypothetical protein